MAQSHVVSALVAKHAELAGEVQEAERRLARLRADLAHLEGALRVFDPEFRPEGIRPKRPVQRDERFVPGELPRLVLDTLRTAPGPLTTRDLARRVMAAKGLDAGDVRLLECVDKRVGGYLRRGGGDLVEPVDGDGGGMRWRVAG